MSLDGTDGSGHIAQWLSTTQRKPDPTWSISVESWPHQLEKRADVCAHAPDPDGMENTMS